VLAVDFEHQEKFPRGNSSYIHGIIHKNMQTINKTHCIAKQRSFYAYIK